MMLYYLADWIYSHIARDPYARMTMTIPIPLREQIQIEAIKQQMTPVAFLQNCILLGFRVCEIERTQGVTLIVRVGEEETELTFQ